VSLDGGYRTKWYMSVRACHSLHGRLCTARPPVKASLTARWRAALTGPVRAALKPSFLTRGNGRLGSVRLSAGCRLPAPAAESKTAFYTEGLIPLLTKPTTLYMARFENGSPQGLTSRRRSALAVNPGVSPNMQISEPPISGSDHLMIK
jgi:hypothetical protein